MFSKKMSFIIGLALTIVIFWGVISNATTTLTSIEPILSYDETAENDVETSNSIDPSGALSASTSNREIPNGIQITEGADSELADILTASQEKSGATAENEVVDGTSSDEIDEEYETNNIEDDVYSIGEEEVVIDKYVSGNIYVIAKKVTINSTVNGNAFIIAENIDNNGQVIGSIYELANNINFGNNAMVSKTAYLISERCTMSENVTFSQDVKVIASDLNFNASIYRNMFALAEKITLGSDSYIKEGGSITYTDEIKDSSGDYTDIIQKAEDFTKETVNAKLDFTSSIVFKVLKYVSTLVLIIFMVSVTRKYSLSYEAEGKRREFKAGMVGLLHLVLMPILSVILIISFIGMPIGIIVFLSWLVTSIILAKPAVAMYFAKLICKNRDWNCDGYIKISFIAIAIYLVLDLISLIPVVGEIIRVICTIYGYGIVVSAIHSRGAKCCCKKSNNEEKAEEKIDG